MSNNRQLKIAFLIDDSLDSVDGVQQYVICLGAYLSRRGHQVYYLTNGSQRLDIANLYSFGRTVRVNFNGNRVGTPLPFANKKIREFLDNQKFDIIHVQSPHSPIFAGRFIKASSNTKIVASLQVLPASRLADTGIKLLGSLLRNNLAKIDAFIANTPHTADFFKRTWSVDSEVIPLPVRVSNFATKKRLVYQPGKINLVFLGRLVPRKGILQLIEALDLLDQKFQSKIAVHIGGTGQLERQITTKVNQTNLKNFVKLYGFVEEFDKPAFLASGDIAVFPSISGESFGISLLEAMASGFSVVLAGHNHGYSHVLGHQPSLMFDGRQPKSIASRLSFWLKCSNQGRQQMSLSLQEYVKKYDIDTVVGPQTLGLYNRILTTKVSAQN